MLFTLILSFATAGAFDSMGNSNVAVYWGQNSGGGSLADYCKGSSSDIVLLSFLSSFGVSDFDLSVGSSCSGTDCTSLGSDIKACQDSGKKVLLSLGGASGSYGLNSESQAKDVADKLWSSFGGGSGNNRPFGDVTLDGFDLDIEAPQGSKYYVTLAQELRKKYSDDSSKDYYVSASPQCPLPDRSLNEALTNADIDFAFVQFYNNYCKIGGQFNFDSWDKFARTQSHNKKLRVFLGVPGSQSAAGSGYNPIDEVKSVISKLQSQYDSFSGVSIWDASLAEKNGNFAGKVKEALTAGEDATSSTSSGAFTTSSTSAESSTTIVSSVSSQAVSPVSKSSSQIRSSETPRQVRTPSTIRSNTNELTSSTSLSIKSTSPTIESSISQSSYLSVAPSSKGSGTNFQTTKGSSLVSSLNTAPDTTTSVSVRKSTIPSKIGTATYSSTASSLTVPSVWLKSSSSTVLATSVTTGTGSIQLSTTEKSVPESSGPTAFPSSESQYTLSTSSSSTSHLEPFSTFSPLSDLSTSSTVLNEPSSSSKFTITSSRLSLETSEMPRSSESSYMTTSVSSQWSPDSIVPTPTTFSQVLTSSSAVSANSESSSSQITAQSKSQPPVSSASNSQSSPTDGGYCPSLGSMQCSGSGFITCDNNHWIWRACVPGTTCKDDNGQVYCGFP